MKYYNGGWFPAYTLTFIGMLALVTWLLSGCSLLVAGVVGAAVTPLVQPQIDRALHELDLDWVDPAGTDAVKGK
jgi:hypothetical protein